MHVLGIAADLAFGTPDQATRARAARPPLRAHDQALWRPVQTHKPGETIRLTPNQDRLLAGAHPA